MVQMFFHGMKLFFTGKLFRDHRAAFIQWLKGFAVTLVALLVVGRLASPLAGVIVAALIGGILQPLLFKDVKYA